MFCSNCGKAVPEGAKFCPSCGFSIASQENNLKNSTKQDPNRLLLAVKPVFIAWVAILSVLPIQIFFTIWGAGFFGGFSFVAVEALNWNLPKGFTFIFFGLLFFLGIPAVTYFAKKRTYEATEYKFYGDHLEYAEGFWTAENKSIRYSKIQEVSFRSGIVQRKYGLGTIFLSTSATGFVSGRSRSGIRIVDVPNAEKIYHALKKTIEEQS